MEELAQSIEASMKRVLKATWAGNARQGADYYCIELDCGHHTHASEDALRGRMCCIRCFTFPAADTKDHATTEGVNE